MSSGGFGDQAVRTDAAQITLALKRALAALLGLRTGPLFLRPRALPGPFSDQAQWDRAKNRRFGVGSARKIDNFLHLAFLN